MDDRREWTRRLGVFAPLALATVGALVASHWRLDLFAQPRAQEPAFVADVNLMFQDETTARRKSAGCIACHANACDPHYGADQPTHTKTIHLGCCDCHGGNPSA